MNGDSTKKASEQLRVWRWPSERLAECADESVLLINPII